MAARVLIVEDDPDGCRSVTEAVADAGFEPVAFGTGEAALEAFRAQPFDAVLTDLKLPGIDGMEVLATVRRADDQIPVLIMTAYGTVSSAVQALKSGANDYILKPLDLHELQTKLARAVEMSRLRAEVARLSRGEEDRYSARAMVAASAAMQDVIRQIRALADTNATVLILGESGTGKELAARALHVDGRRRHGPFVAVNCGAFAESLLESELFGHEKGAFTGAAVQHKGAFERADGGTLFLDEVGNAPPSVQVKLLRVLEERELLRVGGQSPVRVNVRVISASNRDLDGLARDGRFREDLLYRLKVVTLRLPPLRERREDIRPLIDRFVALAAVEHGHPIERVDPAYVEAFEKYDWPGNVRQLRNAVAASVIMARGSALTQADIRLDDIRPPAGAATPTSLPDSATLNDIERAALEAALKRHGGNRTVAAARLGISRRTIQRKIREYGLPY